MEFTTHLFAIMQILIILSVIKIRQLFFFFKFYSFTFLLHKLAFGENFQVYVEKVFLKNP